MTNDTPFLFSPHPEFLLKEEEETGTKGNSKAGVYFVTPTNIDLSSVKDLSFGDDLGGLLPTPEPNLASPV